MYHKENKGFTLIETVIALLVLALTFGSAMALLRNSVKNRSIVSQKIFSQWAVHNYVIQKQADGWAKIGKQEEYVSMGKYDFKIHTEVVKTGSASFRKLRAKVYTNDGKQELSNMVAYSAKNIRW